MAAGRDAASALELALEEDLLDNGANDALEARRPAPQEGQPDGIAPPPKEGPQPEDQGGHAPRHNFQHRRAVTVVIGLILFAVALAGLYIYWEYSEHFEFDGRRVYRGAPVRDSPEGVGLHNRRARHR